MRVLAFRLLWGIAWPARQYLRRTSPHRGRGLVESLLVRTTLPLAPESFVAQLPSGGEIELRYRDQIGLSTLLNGAFEAAEVATLAGLVRPGTTVVDAGANVGVFTVPLARSVGAEGTVLAFEPTEETAEQLRRNVLRNGLSNVKVIKSALGARRGTTMLRVEADGAFNSIAGEGGESGRLVDVERLDDVWEGSGRPPVSAVKIDVEGFELEVLQGAEAMLGESRPAILLEAAETERQVELTEWLVQRGYRRAPTTGFQPWNLLFTANGAPERMPV